MIERYCGSPLDLRNDWALRSKRTLAEVSESQMKAAIVVTALSIARAQNVARQPYVCVRTPPMAGPMTGLLSC